ncbi:sigma 54-interacting transcriptional regulator [Bacillus haikouensis]|uniref:sigma 54-interacting transcriptional regulator n=1 Tax=Bacillus haikouensis TaxID=1510468 RepID=UPI0015518C0C|nr:sigma 54-interacting transcriptional regulator [Bacillus haikouensis]NQD64998.1 sigma 54-interacting transcriptional regulator [Bacillus haikouensis]
MDNIYVIAPFDLTKEQKHLMEKQMVDRPYNVTFLETLFPYERTLEEIPASASVIVSRGGLGEYLHTEAQIPYVHIPVTPYDLLRAVSQVYGKGYRKIVVLMFDQIIKDTEAFSLDFKDATVQVLSYNHSKELTQLLKDLIKTEQVDSIIGDIRAVLSAEKNNLYTYLLKSGQESLQLALEQAIRTLELKYQEQSKRKELELILYSMQQAVIVVDEKNRIKTFNEKAKMIFPRLKNLAQSNEYREVISNDTLIHHIDNQEDHRNVLIEIENQKVLVTTLITRTNGLYGGAVQMFEKLNDIKQLELKIRKEVFKKGLIAKYTFSDIITINDEMKNIVKTAEVYAPSEGTVLIYGETGTGKELFAQSIHNASNRQKNPFVSLNCGSLSEPLLESELFGYEEGSFTGANRGGRAGLLELAHGGTLFLDEINEMSRAFQTKLLRVLQEEEVRRVGGNRNIPVDVRIICASNITIGELIEQGKFKEDLFYRISTLPLNILPLRERKNDIIPLTVHFLKIEMDREKRYLTWQDTSSFSPLLSYPWLGNARELQNIIRRLVITYPHYEITKEGLEQFLKTSLPKRKQEILIPVLDSYKDMERELWNKLYHQFNGTKKEFCQKFEISETTLWRKISNMK